MAELDPAVVASVTNFDFKAMAEIIPAAYAQAAALAATDAVYVQRMANADALSHQRLMNGLREVLFMEAAGQRAGIDIPEAVANKKTAEADLARSMQELGAQVSQLQQLLKGAQTTPPVTVPPPAAG